MLLVTEYIPGATCLGLHIDRVTEDLQYLKNLINHVPNIIWTSLIDDKYFCEVSLTLVHW